MPHVTSENEKAIEDALRHYQMIDVCGKAERIGG